MVYDSTKEDGYVNWSFLLYPELTGVSKNHHRLLQADILGIHAPQQSCGETYDNLMVTFALFWHVQ